VWHAVNTLPALVDVVAGDAQIARSRLQLLPGQLLDVPVAALKQQIESEVRAAPVLLDPVRAAR